MSRDILFDHGNARFSCRMSALIVQGGRILLQCPVGTQEYAFPGGHTALGETSAETLRRELREELHADAAIGRLAAVGKHDELYATNDAYRKMVDLQKLEEEGGGQDA